MVKTLIKQEYISPKISERELDNLFSEIYKHNLMKYIICKFLYIYGRNVNEIYLMKKEDIDFVEKTVKFKINNEFIEYPLESGLINDLKAFVEDCDGKFLFVDDSFESIDNFSGKLNYFLKKFDEVNNVHISPRDFKKLRGQHLVLSGLSIKSISVLFNYHDSSSLHRLLVDDCFLIDFVDVKSFDELFNKV